MCHHHLNLPRSVHPQAREELLSNQSLLLKKTIKTFRHLVFHVFLRSVFSRSLLLLLFIPCSIQSLYYSIFLLMPRQMQCTGTNKNSFNHLEAYRKLNRMRCTMGRVQMTCSFLSIRYLSLSDYLSVRFELAGALAGVLPGLVGPCRASTGLIWPIR